MARWYRAYEGTVSDPKLAEAALGAGCSRSLVIAVWHSILEACAHRNEGGAFDLPIKRVAAVLCEPLDVIERVFAELTEIGMIGNGEVFAWKRRQYESDTSTERSRKLRERRRNDDATLQGRCATECNADATPPEYREQNTEEKKERHSGGRVATRPQINSDFDEFWKAYPRRKGANPRKPARDKFEAFVKSGVPSAEMISAARVFANEAAKDKSVGTRFVPQAITWLDQARWEDYGTGVATSAPTGVLITPDMPNWEAWRLHFEADGLRARIAMMDQARDLRQPFPVRTLWPPSGALARDGPSDDGRGAEMEPCLSGFGDAR